MNYLHLFRIVLILTGLPKLGPLWVQNRLRNLSARSHSMENIEMCVHAETALKEFLDSLDRDYVG